MCFTHTCIEYQNFIFWLRIFLKTYPVPLLPTVLCRWWLSSHGAWWEMHTYWNLADGYQASFSTQPGTWINLSTAAPNADAISTMPWVKDTEWRWGRWGREEALCVSVSASLRGWMKWGLSPPPSLFPDIVKQDSLRILIQPLHSPPADFKSWRVFYPRRSLSLPAPETPEKRLISALGREAWLLLHRLCGMWSSELSVGVIVPQRRQTDERKETRLPHLKAESHVCI